MQEVGVEAVVKGLQGFLGDMRQVNSALDGIRPTGTLLEQMFESVSNAASGFGREVLNVVETALGVMLRDAIEFVIGKFGELVQAIIETGSEFQLLKIRLTGLNLNETADGIKPFNQAMDEAVAKTTEELDWLQTLGSATPFDPAQIANTFTMARAFGFASDEAKRLTTDIINYTAGMGLSNETLFLVIQNMGQMVQRGKITGTEIRDLARGSYLPLADVLQRIATNMHMTVKELTQKISTPEGIPAQEFVKAFEQMVEEEPRFVGAAGRMSRALLPASQNVKELFTSIFGLNVATPVFDVLGEKVAGLVDQFAFFNEQGDLIKTQRWTDLVTAAKNLGDALSSIIKEILGFIPSTDSLADGLISGIQGFADWINNNRGGIIDFFRGIGNSIQNDIIPFIRDQLIPAIAGFGQWIFDNKESILGFFTGIGDVIQNTIIPFVRDQLIPTFELISAWVTVNKPTIDEFFNSIGTIIGNVFAAITGGPKPEEGAGILGILNAIKGFMEFVNTHKEEITKFVEVLWTLFIVSQVLAVIFNIVAGAIAAVIGVALTLGAVFGTISLIIAILTSPITLVIAALVGLGAIFVWLVLRSLESWNNISITAQQALFLIQYYFITFMTSLTEKATKLWDSLKGIFARIWDSIARIDWGGLGLSIIQGIANGITSGIGAIVNAAVSAAQSAYNAAMGFLQGGSPSKLFEQVGVWTMEGFAQGIQKYASTAAGAMTSAMQQVAAPAISMPGIIQSVVAQGMGNSTTNTDARSFNLTVHSNANSEPVVQDFQMMQSLAGA